MAINIWEGSRVQEIWRTETRGEVPKGPPLLTITMGSTNPDTMRKRGREHTENAEQGGTTMQKLMAHHPKLSRLLERRQAMRGSPPSDYEERSGENQNHITINYEQIGGVHAADRMEGEDGTGR